MMHRLEPDALRDARPLASGRAASTHCSSGEPYRANRAHLADLLIAELTRSPAGIGDLVAEALARLRLAPAVTLHLHPDDRALLPPPARLCEAHGMHGALAIVEDPSLTRGGCLLQSADGTLDARVETRVELLLAAAEASA